MTPRFVWADLSAHDFPAAQRFYADVFGWSYQDLTDGYRIASVGDGPVAGLFAMPEKFVRINMPSFWMSYLHVDDLDAVVSAAESHGGKVEVRPGPAPGGGRIALIRDPAGAGFTLYEGDGLGGESPTTDPGRRAWHELHVSDLDRVAGFYRGVFGWVIEPASTHGRHEIKTADGEVVAGLQVTPNELKGDKEYWGVYFAVAGLAEAQQRIERAGGRVETEQPLDDRPALLAYDNQGAAFYVVEGKGKNSGIRTSKLKWRAMLGLLLVALAVAFEQNWVWGLLFLVWVLPDLISGSTHFLEHVERRRNPVVYWLIITAWLLLSLYFFASPP